jgi:predicted peptidase
MSAPCLSLSWSAVALAVVVAMVLPTGAVGAAERGQEPKLFEKEITIKAKLGYLLSLPPGYEADATKKWPLIVFLHGAGESGSDLDKVKIHGPPKLIAAGTFDHPCIVVSPQCPGRGWNADMVGALVDELCREYRVDEDRVYLTGLSMGGFGTWALAAARPERFAAIAPICGGGNPVDAIKLRGLPIWVFHGEKDTVVPLVASQAMVTALEALGQKDNVKFTIYPGVGHDSWTATYDDPEFYRWLFAQKRGAAGGK